MAKEKWKEAQIGFSILWGKREWKWMNKQIIQVVTAGKKEMEEEETESCIGIYVF